MRLTILFITLLPSCLTIEPISITYLIGSAVTSLGGYLYYNFYSCVKVECCKDPWLHEPPLIDFSELFGQPIVVQVVSDILRKRQLLPKPISLSFHGPTGTGKTFVSSLISKMIFKKGVNSEFVRVFTVPHDFYDPLKGFEYQNMVTKVIMSQLSKCEKSVFIFEELEKAPAVANAIAPFLEQRGLVNGVNTKQATFIFLSNIGSKAIVAKTYEMWKNGVNRNDFKLRDFENEIKLAVFNEEGTRTYKDSDIVKKELIHAYVPFLPLEKQHVKSCIRTDFWNINRRDPTPDEIEEMLLDIRFSPNKLYAETGCAKVSSLVLRFSND